MRRVTRLMELLLGLPRGFLSEEGDVSVAFNPVWPWQEVVGAAVWNVALLGVLVWVVVWVYRRDGRSSGARAGLGALRLALVLLLVVLLNRPVVQLTQSRVEPSVVAVLVDDSVSMKVADESGGRQRLAAAVAALVGGQEEGGGAGLLDLLAREHVVRVYRFGPTAEGLGVWEGREGAVAAGLARLRPEAESTWVGGSALAVAGELVGQRVAGVVVLTDGRDAPARGGGIGGGAGGVGEVIARLREAGIKVFAVEVGSDAAPRNLSVQNVVLQDAAFKGDLVGVRVSVGGAGFPAGQRVRVRLVEEGTGRVLPGVGAGSGGGAVAEGVIGEDGRAEVEVVLRPEAVGELELVAEVSAEGAEVGEGEVDAADNRRSARLTVLDTQVAVLYVEGYPRWDYRFLRTELIRDRTVEVSILLTSADEGFAQEGDRPIRRFPETMEELLAYDVVILGDVDPRQFTDAQLQLLAEFVGEKGGGLMMVAGTRYAPWAYRGSPIEALLPVVIGSGEAPRAGSGGRGDGEIAAGYRMSVTPAGLSSGVFRFLADSEANARYLREEMQMLFWFAPGVSVKPGAGEVLAEHPAETGPDGRKVPLLVAGRYGAGRTIFSGVDESWRLRYYTGESVFDTYWVQQIRLLARGRKLGQRLVTMQAVRPVVELGEMASVVVRVLEGNLLRQLPDRLEVERLDGGVDGGGAVVGREALVRQEDRPDTFVGEWRADRVGRTVVRLPFVAPGMSEVTAAYETMVPRLELTDPRVDRDALRRLATETGGASVGLGEAGGLAGRVVSAAKVIPVETSKPVWDAPLAMLLFVVLITSEWVMRKVYGMV